MRDKVTIPEELSADSFVDSSNGVDLQERQQVVTKLRLLWDRRDFLLRLTGIALALSTIIAFLVPKTFDSTTRLMPPDQMNSAMEMLTAAAGSKGEGGASGLGSVAGSLLGLKTSGELFVGILGSRTVEDDLINKFDLRKVYKDRFMEDAREDLEKHTSITEDRQSGIITIVVTDKVPRRAAAMGQEYVEELDSLVARVNTTSAHRERVFLEGRLAQVQKDLETAEKGFSEFASKNSAIDIQSQGKAMIEAGAALEGQLIAAQTELQGLRQIYADGNVRVRATQARVNELQMQLEKLGGKYDSTITADTDNDQTMFPSIRRLPLLGVGYADLFRTTKVQEAVFETLTQEYELSKVEEAKETPSVKVIDPPDLPEKKASPHRLLIMLVGTLFCFLFGVAWILGDSHWGHIDSHDPGKVFALEVFGTIRSRLPFLSTNGKGSAEVKDARSRGASTQ